MDTDDGQGPSSSSEEDSSVDEDAIPIELTKYLREVLEQDYALINTKNKVCFCGKLYFINKNLVVNIC